MRGWDVTVCVTNGDRPLLFSKKDKKAATEFVKRIMKQGFTVIEVSDIEKYYPAHVISLIRVEKTEDF